MSRQAIFHVATDGLPNLREAVFYGVDGQSCFGVIPMLRIKIFESELVRAGFTPAL